MDTESEKEKFKKRGESGEEDALAERQRNPRFFPTVIKKKRRREDFGIPRAKKKHLLQHRSKRKNSASKRSHKSKSTGAPPRFWGEKVVRTSTGHIRRNLKRKSLTVKGG